GNGVLSRSLVSGLLRRNAQSPQDDIHVRVICARPHPTAHDVSSDVVTLNEHECLVDHLEIWPIDLPMGCLWKRLDRYGPWKEFVAGCTGGNGNPDYSQLVREFEPMEVVAVDWHGMLIWEEICRSFNDVEGCLLEGVWCPSIATTCYYNFRVYSSSSWDHPVNARFSSDNSAEKGDEQFYLEQEQHSCRLADAIICLSEHDRQNLKILMRQDSLLIDEECTMKMAEIGILPPPIRGDILELANRDVDDFISHLPDEAASAINWLSQSLPNPIPQRVFITCMVRLSPEKSPHHFVFFIEKLGGIKFLKSLNLIPLICGAKSVESYAESVLGDLTSLCQCSSSNDDEWPCVIIDRFLGPAEMAAVFSRTALNFHPCLYDAYGMTVVESTAFGAVTIVNKGGKVGATSLLKEGKGCVGIDLHGIVVDNNIDVSDCRELIKTHQKSFKKIGQEGRRLAMGWNEHAYCISLLDMLSKHSKCNR
ncbi:hypothetical protein ACHAWX_001837, partial [Stephanocyclus meneghinianus]